MFQHAQCTILLLMVAYSAALNPVSVPGNGDSATCPLQEMKDAVIQNISASVWNRLSTLNQFSSNQCGSGKWYLIAHLNMSNSSQQCPSAWREYNTSGVRGCRRPETTSGSCPANSYATSRQYSRVCGRVIGYQIGGTNAFGNFAVGQTIDSYYVYGVSVTHGTPRNHIWTVAAGLSEGEFQPQESNCPCSKPSDPGNKFPPSFVGNNYYCESGNPGVTFTEFHPTDPLWDGQQCEGECCSNGKSPPWFSVELPNPTTDDIEVRICIAEASHDDIAIQLLELYVQ